MEEGLFTFIFIVLLVLMSIMDAVGRRRQRGRKMEEMEQEEAAEGREAGRPGRPGAGAAARPGPRTAPGPGRAEGTASRPGEAGGPARETADQMIPEDFWAILTGQAPPEREPAPPETPREDAPRRVEAPAPSGRVSRAEDPAARREPDALGRRGDPSPPKDPDIPFPLPGDRISTADDQARRKAAEAPPTRRSARWMEGLEREAPDRLPPPIEADEAEIYGTMEEPWGALGDIAAGDLMEERPGRAPGGRPFPKADEARGRRARGRGLYTRLLESGNVEDLRKAIVLREVLGPPVGTKDDREGPGGW